MAPLDTCRCLPCQGRLNLHWGFVLPGQCRHVVLFGGADLRRHGCGAWRCARTVTEATRGSPTHAQLEPKKLHSQSALVPWTVCFVAAVGQCVHKSHVCLSVRLSMCLSICLSVCLCMRRLVFLFFVFCSFRCLHKKRPSQCLYVFQTPLPPLQS